MPINWKNVRRIAGNVLKAVLKHGKRRATKSFEVGTGGLTEVIKKKL